MHTPLPAKYGTYERVTDDSLPPASGVAAETKEVLCESVQRQKPLRWVR